jgi:glycosyltransferase involved in cell wall biosynthesis
VFLVTEWINTLAGMYRERLLTAYDRLHWPCPHKWAPNDPAISEETEIALRSDAAFAPSEFIKQSLLDVAVPEERIICTSYGWDPKRLVPTGPRKPKPEGITYLFVGKDSFRKGLPLLLQMWRDARIERGRLIVAGNISEEIRTRCRDLLDQESILPCGYVLNLADLYYNADVVVHPSIEEGSPLVTYEMAACGLALILSPMSAGGMIRDGIDGCVIEDPFDLEQWVHTMRKMASDKGFLQEMKAAARRRAQDFTWDKVGASRREALLRKFRNKDQARAPVAEVSGSTITPGGA